MKTEINYLIAFDKTKLQFKSLDKIIALIGLLDNVVLDDNGIEHNGSKFEFSFTEEKIVLENSDALMLLDMKITANRNEKDIEQLSGLLRKIRLLVHNNKGNITLVFDGVSAFYAEKAYPQIHYIENLMRQLYAKFAVFSLGPAWAESIPKDLTANKKSDAGTTNPLYDLDFIQINEVLFTEYALKETDADFFNKLKSNELEKLDLKDYIPQSNWVKLFDSKLNCEEQFLKSRWKKLYQLRNKVAHNRDFSKADFEETKKITTEIRDIVVPAMSKITKMDHKVALVEPPTKAAVAVANMNQGKPKVEMRKSDDAGKLLLVGLLGAFLFSGK